VRPARPAEAPGTETASHVLELDGAVCDGHGICVLCCPERVSLDEWGFAVVDGTPIRDPATRRRAHRAVRACPAGALRLEPRDAAASGDRRPAMPRPQPGRAAR
jgi:ferredoxin